MLSDARKAAFIHASVLFFVKACSSCDYCKPLIRILMVAIGVADALALVALAAAAAALLLLLFSFFLCCCLTLLLTAAIPSPVSELSQDFRTQRNTRASEGRVPGTFRGGRGGGGKLS